MANIHIQLEGRVFLTFDIEAVTGLHIGGSFEGISIGGVDKTVIRDPLTNRPYIPGSSLRGKMRSLTEKHLGRPQNQRVGQSYIHSCGADGNGNAKDEYLKCAVCQVYGVPGERTFATPTRLIVRDVFLTEESAKGLEGAHTDLPFTEIKTEVSIDRVTSAANPRQMERVPAGAIFGPAQLVYNIYSGDDCDPKRDLEHFREVVTGLQLLEDDYLGGLGSRGSGRVKLQRIRVEGRNRTDYRHLETLAEYEYPAGLEQLVAGLDELVEKIEGYVLKKT